MHRYILSLGSDLGERLNNLAAAIRLLSRRGVHLHASSVYETAPVDMDTSALFLNCAVEFRTYLDPPRMLDFCKDIEQRLGRGTRGSRESRPVDIDIITWSGGSWRDDRLQIPHPRAGERLFVQVPVAEIAPGLLSPLNKTRKKKDMPGQIEKFCGPDILFLPPGRPSGGQ